MLEPKIIRSEPERIAKALEKRGFVFDIEKAHALESKRKALQRDTEILQHEKNQKAKAVGQAKAKGEPLESYLEKVEKLNEALKQSEQSLHVLQKEIYDFYLNIPNLPDESVPVGEDEADNFEVKKWGEPKVFAYAPKDHVELTEQKGDLNLNLGAKLSGKRFVVLKSNVARLHRALGQFMLDMHIQHGYTECYTPYLVHGDCLVGTGQFPKLTEDVFKIEAQDMFLIPTSEVTLTNMVADEILLEKNLPLKFVAHTPCFRKEAGNYGKDTRGMFRHHQFDKVELVHVVHPEHSFNALESLVSDVERVMQALKLPYRVMSLCGGDLGFSSAKTYDIEVWLPGQNKYREISSCSNMLAFQARRMKTRFRSEMTKKTEFVHTLNGSGVAIGRALIAVLENYQQDNGQILVPEVLIPYMQGQEIIDV